MATIQNDRDVRLQATVPRNINPAAGKALLLSSTTQNFQVSTASVGTPSSISFKAVLLGFPTGSIVTWSASAGGILTGTGNTRDLAFSDMSAGSVNVTASFVYGGTTFSEIRTITKVTDGSASGVSNAVIYAYQRAAAAPTLKPGAVTFTFSSGTITTPTTDALANGWSKTIPAGANPLYVCVASASANTATDAVADAEWTTPVLLVSDGTSGTNGINTATVYLYQRAATNVAPALPSVATTYTFNPPSLSAPGSGWATVPPSTGGDYLFVTLATAAATTATDNIPATEWAVAALMANNGVNGTSALSNGQAFAYQRSATALTSNPGDVAYSFASGTITTASLLNGWTKAIPAGTNPLYVTIAAASNSANTDAILAAEWAAPVMLAQDGLAGLNTATMFIYQRAASATAPALPSVATTYTFSPAGLAGLNNGWATTIPLSGGSYVFVSTATASATANTDSIASTEWAAASILSQDGQGARGAGSYYITGTAWPANDPTADAAASAATPGADLVDDVVTMSGTNFVMVKRWTGTAWAPLGQVLDGNLIVTGTVTAAKINSNGLTIRDASGNAMLGSGSALDWAKLVATGLTGGAAIQNSSISISAAGTLSGAAGGTVTIGGLGYSGALNANYTTNTNQLADGANLGGTAAWGSVSARPANVAALAGTEGINNASVSISAAGALSGAGGGAVTIGGLGYTGHLAATSNLGDFAKLSGTITELNAATYFALNSLPGTYIKNLAADKLTAGTLVAGVIYAGAIAASQVTAGTMTGHTIQTAASGTRIAINEASNNMLKAYDAGGAVLVSIGGTSNGYIYATSNGSLMGAIYGAGSGSFPAVYGTTSSTASFSAAGYFAASGAAAGVECKSSTGAALKISGGANGIVQTSTGSNFLNTVNPGTDGGHDLGTSGAFRWGAVYANSSNITTSDARTKTEITDSNLGLAFIMALRPVSYRQKVAENVVTWLPGCPTNDPRDPEPIKLVTPRVGTRAHYGLIAQEVRQALLDAGAPNASIWSMGDPADPESGQALRYDELIAPLIRAVQEQQERIIALEARQSHL